MNEQISPSQINAAGHLTIGGCDAVDLAHEYGTPLGVYDVSQIKSQIQHFQEVFKNNDVDYAVCYASKAFANTAMYQLVHEMDCHVDVVSAGEISMALHAGFPASKMTFHGNNKSREELQLAVDQGLGVIALDNFHEIDLLSDILEKSQAEIKVLLRITPGISAHTHEYIQTGQIDSKFGFDLESGQADQALQRVLQEPRMHMLGVHAHIGSQIFELAGFEGAGKKLVDLAADWKKRFDYEAEVINVGGGFGIRYTQADRPLKPEQFVDIIIKTIKQESQAAGLKTPAVWIEPGRSIAGPAGYSLYTIGSRKDVKGIRPYLAVDGGMGDNIRPALYDAQYEAAVANRPAAPAVETVHIAGKYCESGDILIQEQALPETQPGDILVMFDTGAYGYSMASNYNLNPKPAIVFVENGQATLVTRRETPSDLERLDFGLNGQQLS
ncbi:diaminopimelate decarboxylase [Convivina intestini]|uniref:Diaminopimelate decarboxylase n=1 Tax=Convivina intestini TaxID=1505726 RepID=A0A2U1D670_9LACO|nr:diaminopimelate decarboxylase [Convivina intestini]PVY83175.1 diaminopimelate decarboxylase [Convivina intestini]CAH1856171.1 Diaminopimelate decarboxylase [Convivina intestini]SDB96005.1 diaminopimelate decarboxylase [Leuconostocaceae bacterium R-53105]